MSEQVIVSMQFHIDVFDPMQLKASQISAVQGEDGPLLQAERTVSELAASALFREAVEHLMSTSESFGIHVRGGGAKPLAVPDISPSE